MAIGMRTIEQAKQDLDMIVSRNKALEVENGDLKERLSKLESEISALKEITKDFEPFLDILENPPTRHIVTITDKALAMRLAIRTRKVFRRRAARADMSEEQISKAERLSRDIVATAAMKMGLGPAWDRTYQNYLIPPAM